jgi:hypothetical protein
VVSVSAQDQDAVLKLKNQIIDLQNRGALGFREFALCSKTLDYGSYVPLDKPQVLQGTDLQVSYEPVNIFTNRNKGKVLYATNSLELGELGPGKYLSKAVLVSVSAGDQLLHGLRDPGEPPRPCSPAGWSWPGCLDGTPPHHHSAPGPR